MYRLLEQSMTKGGFRYLSFENGSRTVGFMLTPVLLFLISRFNTTSSLTRQSNRLIISFLGVPPGDLDGYLIPVRFDYTASTWLWISQQRTKAETRTRLTSNKSLIRGENIIATIMRLRNDSIRGRSSSRSRQSSTSAIDRLTGV